MAQMRERSITHDGQDMEQKRWGKYDQGMVLNRVGERLHDSNCSWNDD